MTPYLQLPFSEPTINEVLSLSIWDQDIGKSDEIVGNITFQLKDIKENKVFLFYLLILFRL